MVAEPRICPVCRSEFIPTALGQRYCPPTDEQRKRHKQPRSRCARRGINHRRRTREGRNTTALTAPLPSAYDCNHCGVRCIPGENVPPHATHYCGPALQESRLEGQAGDSKRFDGGTSEHISAHRGHFHKTLRLAAQESA